MAAAFLHKLGGGCSFCPVILVEVSDIQVQCLGYQGAGGDASPGPAGGAGLAMALVQHDSPGRVQLLGRCEVHIGNQEVEDGSKVEETCLASSTVVAGRYGEQVQHILSQSLEQSLSFINRDGRYRGSRLGNFDDVEICLGSCNEGGLSISLSSIRDLQVGQSFIEAIGNTISLIAVLSHLQKVNRRSTAILSSSDSCL